MLCLYTESCLPTLFPHMVHIPSLVETSQQLTGSLPALVSGCLPVVLYTVALGDFPPPCYIFSSSGLPAMFQLRLLLCSSHDHLFPLASVLPLNIMPMIVTRCSLSQLALVVMHSFIIHSVHKHLFRAYSLSTSC